MSLANVKDAIKTNLDELVTAEVLSAATITDIKKDPLDGKVPHKSAYLMPPSIKSEANDNRTNIRTCDFPILVVYKAKNLTDTTEIETNIEAILNKFDNDPTLSGTAMGGIQPVSSAPEPFQHGGKDLIIVEIVISAKHLVTLTY